MGARSKTPDGERETMKLRFFAFAGTAALALSACNSSNQDTVDNAELNQPAAELNDLSTDAANDAANSEAAALGDQQNQLESENAAAPDNTANPTDDQEQNVSGM